MSIAVSTIDVKATATRELSSVAKDAEAESAADHFIQILNSSKDIWGYSSRGLQAKKAAMAMVGTKNGMYAKIPLICKGENCPYAESCKLLPYDLTPEGEPCPIETSLVEKLGIGYSEDVGYDSASFTDRMMISDLIKYDVMLERCISMMSKEGTPVIDVVMGISDQGDEIRQPQVSKYWEAYERIVKKRNETYQLLMMTRKDKSKNGEDSSENLSDVLQNIINSD